MADLFVAEHPGPAGAPRVVLVHGSLDRSTAFLRVIRRLADCSVVRYDRRGYGRSLAVGAARRFQDQVDDLAAVVAGIPSVLVGHSLGGVIALALAAQQPELATAVVAFEAPMPWTPWWPQGTAGSRAASQGEEAGAAERFMRRLIGDDRWEALPARTQAQRRAESPALVAELRSIRPPAPAPYRPEALSMPVWAAHGGRSEPHHQETARRLAALAPSGRLAVIDGAGHGAHLSHPSEFAGLVRAALP